VRACVHARVREGGREGGSVQCQMNFFQQYQLENKMHFNEMMVRSTLYILGYD
jgi:hypothetical protein